MSSLTVTRPTVSHASVAKVAQAHLTAAVAARGDMGDVDGAAEAVNATLMALQADEESLVPPEDAITASALYDEDEMPASETHHLVPARLVPLFARRCPRRRRRVSFRRKPW